MPSLLRIAAAVLITVGAASSAQAQMFHVVFITSIGYSIDPSAGPTPGTNIFGSLAAADFQVNKLGQSPNLLSSYGSLKYTALLSDATTNARDRMPIVGYVWNIGAGLVANDFNDFWDGSIVLGLRRTELSTTVPAGTFIWTGSDQFGYTSQTANNWQSSSSSQEANVGQSFVTNNWFNQGTQPANQSYRLLAISEPLQVDAGDFNDNTRVDAADYVLWRKTIGNTVSRGYYADGDGDGTIGAGDLAVWRANYGKFYGGFGAGAVVPEPSTLLLLGISAISLLGYRKGKSHG